MAEINNALAAQVNAAPVDIGKTLLTIGQIRALNTKSDLEQAQTARSQQDLAHIQNTLSRNGGYDIPETQGLAQTQKIKSETSNVQAETYGRIGNILANNPTPEGVAAAAAVAKSSGIEVPDLVQGHFNSLPPEKIREAGKRLQAYGQSSTSNIEQNPNQIASRTNATTRGAKAGELGIETPAPIPVAAPAPPVTTDRPPVPSSKAIMGDDEAVKAGIYSPTPAQIARGVTGPDFSKPGSMKLEAAKVQARGQEIVDAAPKLAEEYQGYKTDAANATNTKYLLKNLSDDAARFPTGKGANIAGATRQWLQAATQLPVIGDGIKKIVGDNSDPAAAFEAVQKNAGQLTRATLKDVEGRAASEYNMIQKQLPNAELTPKGLSLVTAQMSAPEDYKQAKLIAVERWRSEHGGTIDGFSSDWNKNIGPGAFLFGRLPKDEQAAMVQRLNKTPEGQRTLSSLKSQLKWAHDRGLDSVID